VFEKRCEEPELMDDFSLATDELRRNLDEIEQLNDWVGSKRLLIRALEKIHQKYPQQPLVIADLCCGSGDLLRCIRQWALDKHIDVQLIGIDANSCMVNYAAEKSNAADNISYQKMDIFSPEFKRYQFDIATINSSCHHFNNAELTQLFNQLAKQAKLAVVINDLHRHWLSYFSIKWLTKCFSYSSLSRHDGPLSVLRAFRKTELRQLLHAAGIKKYEIHWRWIFRWEVIIWN
jgi:ubiquinone/menaquinone biosynthesis C-methylase UbiE